MKKALFPITLVFTALSLFAQKEDNVWLFGDVGEPDSTRATTIFDFSGGGGPEINSLYKFIGFYVCSTTISDEEGDLQLYSNGVHIYNNQHEIIENGEEFVSPEEFPVGYAMRQGAMFFPYPGQHDKYLYCHGDFVYYYFDGHLVNGCSPLTYSVVEKDNGAWKVTEKKMTLTQDTVLSGHFTGVRHANGRDWWFIVPPTFGSNRFQKYLIDPSGIHLYDKQEVGQIYNPGLGQGAVSPDGEWVAYYNYFGIFPVSIGISIDIYRFDRCTGQLSDHNQIIYENQGGRGGAAFSPNSRFLYISASDYLYQYDLWADDIPASRVTVAQWDGFIDEQGNAVRFHSLKLGPDGKIYIGSTAGLSRFMGIIENPNLPGIDCSVKQHSIYLPTYIRWAMPNHPVGFNLGPLEGSPCDTILTASEEKIAESFSLYPNPSAGTVSMALPDGSWDAVQVTTAAGQLVHATLLKGESRNVELNLTNLPDGLYFVSLIKDGISSVPTKLVITR